MGWRVVEVILPLAAGVISIALAVAVWFDDKVPLGLRLFVSLIFMAAGCSNLAVAIGVLDEHHAHTCTSASVDPPPTRLAPGDTNDDRR